MITGSFSFASDTIPEETDIPSIPPAASKVSFDHAWSKQGKDLLLKLQLAPDLTFGENYNTGISAKATSCEISCIPVEGKIITNSEGKIFKEMKIAVVLTNTETPNNVTFSIIAKAIFEGTDAEGKIVLERKQRRIEGTLKISGIDVKQRADFFSFEDDISSGAINFKCKS